MVWEHRFPTAWMQCKDGEKLCHQWIIPYPFSFFVRGLEEMIGMLQNNNWDQVRIELGQGWDHRTGLCRLCLFYSLRDWCDFKSSTSLKWPRLVVCGCLCYGFIVFSWFLTNFHGQLCNVGHLAFARKVRSSYRAGDFYKSIYKANHFSNHQTDWVERKISMLKDVERYWKDDGRIQLVHEESTALLMAIFLSGSHDERRPGTPAPDSP